MSFWIVIIIVFMILGVITYYSFESDDEFKKIQQNIRISDTLTSDKIHSNTATNLQNNENTTLEQNESNKNNHSMNSKKAHHYEMSASACANGTLDKLSSSSITNTIQNEGKNNGENNEDFENNTKPKTTRTFQLMENIETKTLPQFLNNIYAEINKTKHQQKNTTVHQLSNAGYLSNMIYIRDAEHIIKSFKKDSAVFQQASTKKCSPYSLIIKPPRTCPK